MPPRIILFCALRPPPPPPRSGLAGVDTQLRHNARAYRKKCQQKSKNNTKQSSKGVEGKLRIATKEVPPMYFPQIDLSFFQLFFQIVIIFSKQSALFFLTMDGNLRSSVPCISRERQSSGQRENFAFQRKTAWSQTRSCDQERWLP